MKCQVYVASRDYSKPGRCAMTRGVKVVRVGRLGVIRACVPHQKIIQSGRPFLRASK